MLNENTSCLMLNENRFLGTFRGHSKRPISRSGDVWLMLTPLHVLINACVGGLKLTSKLAVMACKEPETDVLMSKLYIGHHTQLLT